MSIIHPSIFYVHLKTFFMIIYLNCIKHFSIKRFLITVLFIFLFSFVSLLVLITRLLDEILFPNYRNVKIDKPIFIIANPRSGTTFSHRLMCLDEERYNYTRLYHTIFPSILIFRIVSFFAKIDKYIGEPFKKFFTWCDDKLFKGWENIHPMGFNKSEEDEGTYIFTLITAGIFLLCPFMDEIPWVKFPDKMGKRQQRALMEFYKSTLQRLAYAQGIKRTFLSKNVMSTGRLESLIDYFPDAKIIYLVRNPYESVPSFISMFSLAWKPHSGEIPETSKHHQSWGILGMDYYNYFHEKIKTVPENQQITLKYDDLVENPKATILSIYDKFNLEKNPTFLEKLEKATNTARTYKSEHSYSLEQFGMTKAQVQEKVGWVFDKYGFEK